MGKYSAQIDYGFIAKLEGGNVLDAYVPDAEQSQSGVTVGIGFDLGARNINDLLKLALSSSLIQKLSPYLGLKGERALTYLQAHPLRLTEAEANVLNSGTKTRMIEQLIDRYNDDASVAFDQLPKKWQTVIASLEFQYGNVQMRCPTFWKHVIACDWTAATRELRNFGDRYQTRRHREADYTLS